MLMSAYTFIFDSMPILSVFITLWLWPRENVHKMKYKARARRWCSAKSWKRPKRKQMRKETNSTPNGISWMLCIAYIHECTRSNSTKKNTTYSKGKKTVITNSYEQQAYSVQMLCSGSNSKFFEKKNHGLKSYKMHQSVSAGDFLCLARSRNRHMLLSTQSCWMVTATARAVLIDAEFTLPVTCTSNKKRTKSRNNSISKCTCTRNKRERGIGT